MGIRFLCPNGHKLNVKAFLAGKRGICPQCDAKFLVPKRSGVQADVLEEPEGPTGEAVVLDPGAALPLGYGTTSSPPTPSAQAAPPPAAVPAAAEPTEAWYVRTAAGDQYGPANTPVMQTWVAEGRVTVDCWVWRTGWPDWKTGGHAITFLNGPAQEMEAPTAVTIPGVPIPGVPSNPAPEALPESSSPTAMYQNTRRSRQDRARKVTFFLAGVVLLLFVVLIAVLIKNSG